MRKENGVAAQIGATSRDFNGWTGGSSAHLRLVPLFWDKLVYENEAARCLGKDISCRAPKRQGLRGFGAIQIIWSANFATSTFRTKNGCRQRRQLTSLWRDGPTSAATLTAHRRRRTARQGRPHRCGREVYLPRQRPFEPSSATTCVERVTPSSGWGRGSRRRGLMCPTAIFFGDGMTSTTTMAALRPFLPVP